MTFDISHISKLSNLRLSADETELFSRQMEDIIDMVSDLPEEDGACERAPFDKSMELRSDDVGKSLPLEKVLLNAPKSENGCFAVPRTVD